MRLHTLQLEPLQCRYTDWWQDLIPEQLRAYGHEVNVIKGEPYKAVESGTVLDAFGTNIYKGTQLNQVAEAFKSGVISNGDIIFVADAWFPGIEMIKYISDIAKVKVKTFGVWHAGSITIEDFMAPSHPWAKYFELGFLRALDGIFVGSEYSKASIINRLLFPYVVDEQELRMMSDKIYPIGLPMNFKHIDAILKKKVEKKPIVLFPSRFDIEKRPNVFMDAIECLMSREDFIYTYAEPLTFRFCTGRTNIKTNASWLIEKFHFLQSALKNHPYIRVDFKYNLTKEEYYTELAQATCMVSCTADETFGYCVAEACALGTVPIVPEAYCYPEILDGHTEFMYRTFDDLVDKIKHYVELWGSDQTRDKITEDKDLLRSFVEPYKNTIPQWIEKMRTT